LSRPITFADIARLPAVGYGVPTQFGFSPGGRVLSFLSARDGGLTRFLYAIRPGLDTEPLEVPVSGSLLSEEGLSLEEQLRRERAREVGLGVTRATWAKRAEVLLVPLPDGLHVLQGIFEDPHNPRAVLALRAETGEIVAPELSPDGKRIAFVRGGDLHLLDSSGDKEPRRLTVTGTEGLSNGLSDYVAQEEMERPEAFWWSPDSQKIAFCETDERDVALYRISHLGSDLAGEKAEEVHRYPFAGAENARVRLGVISADGGEPLFFELGEDDHYLARVAWAGDDRLVAVVQSRDQQNLRLLSFETDKPGARILFEEHLEPWINLHDDLCFLSTGEFLWSSEQSGFRHLELRSGDGELVAQLTTGDWQVDKLEGVDEEEGVVYLSATEKSPLERHLYKVALEGGELTRITMEPGTHVVSLEASAGLYVDSWSALDRPPSIRLCSLGDGAVSVALHDTADPRIEELGLRPPEPVIVPAEDGTSLYGLLYRSGTPGEPPRPLVVYVYGGPHVQLAADDWRPTASLRAQALRDRGLHVLVLDNRGSARRGLSFEAPLFHNMGNLEVADQVAGVRWAVDQGIAEPSRIGVYGWSYGGYMALRCLELAPEVFKAGVAGAPVTDWDGYDTHYTERYMGTPESDSAAYAASSVLERAGDIKGELMIVHGLIDENVHFRHSARLISRLVAEAKSYQLLFFPEERHLPRREEDRAYMEQQVIGFLERALLD
jgi:dipeptidyl-peptidase-4